MADLYYGVAGNPVSHSLSPVLMNIMVQHVNSHLKTKDTFKLHCTDLIEESLIQDALAWGYVKSTPKVVDWDLTKSPFGKFRNKAIMNKVLEQTEEIEEPSHHLEFDEFENNIKNLPYESKEKLPTKSFGDEVWINLTSPLKHQLKSQAVVDFNQSSMIESVNVLRWDGFGWWSSNVDGSGVVRLAQMLGIDIANGAIIGIIGGGGAARSTAQTWTKCGGKVAILGGKRDLSEYDWLTSVDPIPNEVDLLIDYDNQQEEVSNIAAKFILQSKYEPTTGTIDERLQAINKANLDGRWLLVAQHLECWKQLWAPQLAEFFPSIELLMTKLIHAETVLASYS